MANPTGVRLRPRHQEEIKLKIQASNILHRIQRYVLEEEYVMHPMKVTAGLKLLAKVLPDAIPESVDTNNQAQALQAISQAQLALMAQEMLRNQGTLGNTINQTVEESVLLTTDTTIVDGSVNQSVEIVIPEFVAK